MDLPSAARGLLGLPMHVAMRPSGIMFRVNERQCILVLGVRGWHQWRIKLGDLVALDWQIFSPEQMVEMRALAQRAAAERAESGENGSS